MNIELSSFPMAFSAPFSVRAKVFSQRCERAGHSAVTKTTIVLQLLFNNHPRKLGRFAKLELQNNGQSLFWSPRGHDLAGFVDSGGGNGYLQN
jgi:hypothetical protein